MPLTLVLSAALSFAAEISTSTPVLWHRQSSPHFEILHESSRAPAAIRLELERMYSFMRLNMAVFAPWMASEKTIIYIYSGRQSYLAGEFKPPQWSKGLAFPDKKAVVVYDTGDIATLKAVLTHELSHLYFKPYFGQSAAGPPQWLDEGLAVFMEDNSYAGGGPWSRALPWLPKERLAALDKFFALKAEELPSESRIVDWYLQSYGVVAWLSQPRQRLQFKNFCGLIRSGKSAEEALREAYLVRNLAEFEKKWLAWLAGYKQKQSGAFTASGKAGAFEFTPAQISRFGFIPFASQK